MSQTLQNQVVSVLFDTSQQVSYDRQKQNSIQKSFRNSSAFEVTEIQKCLTFGNTNDLFMQSRKFAPNFCRCVPITLNLPTIQFEKDQKLKNYYTDIHNIENYFYEKEDFLTLKVAPFQALEESSIHEIFLPLANQIYPQYENRVTFGRAKQQLPSNEFITIDLAAETSQEIEKINLHTKKSTTQIHDSIATDQQDEMAQHFFNLQLYSKSRLRVEGNSRERFQTEPSHVENLYIMNKKPQDCLKPLKKSENQQITSTSASSRAYLNAQQYHTKHSHQLNDNTSHSKSPQNKKQLDQKNESLGLNKPQIILDLYKRPQNKNEGKKQNKGSLVRIDRNDVKQTNPRTKIIQQTPKGQSPKPFYQVQQKPQSSQPNTPRQRYQWEIKQTKKQPKKVSVEVQIEKLPSSPSNKHQQSSILRQEPLKPLVVQQPSSPQEPIQIKLDLKKFLIRQPDYNDQQEQDYKTPSSKSHSPFKQDPEEHQQSLHYSPYFYRESKQQNTSGKKQNFSPIPLGQDIKYINLDLYK